MRSTKSPSWSRRLLGLEPLPVPPHVFAVAPGELAYARFARGADGCELEAYHAVPLPDGVFAGGPLGGPLHDPALLREPLAALLAALDRRVGEASLVLPDAWLRVTFAEAAELPRAAAAREEVLRWKLKRLVPYRVEDLRFDAVDVAPLVGQEEPRRLLLCFGSEGFLAQLEEVFAGFGVRLGQIVAASLAIAAAAHEVTGGEDLTGLLVATADGYALTFLRRGEPVLHRFRALAGAGDREGLVVRDLRLTRTFLAERIPESPLARVLLLAPDREAEGWSARLTAGLERPVVALGREQLPLKGRLPEVALDRLAALLGAASQEAA